MCNVELRKEEILSTDAGEETIFVIQILKFQVLGIGNLQESRKKLREHGSPQLNEVWFQEEEKEQKPSEAVAVDEREGSGKVAFSNSTSTEFKDKDEPAAKSKTHKDVDQMSPLLKRSGSREGGVKPTCIC